MNYFELFNLAESYSVDKTQLNEHYQTLQRLTHPDGFASSSEAEKAIALQKNAMVNDAYHVLKSPLARAEYLLELRGFSINHESQTLQDRSFLMKQMELREMLDDAAQCSDPFAAIESISQEIDDTQRDLFSQLESQLEGEMWESSADSIRKLKFLVKLSAEVELLEERLDDL